MKTEITAGQAIGKTVKGFLCSKTSDQMVVYFDDETFTTFEASREYWGDDYNVIEARMNWFEFGYNDDLFKAGMFSEQEWLAMCKEKDRREEEKTKQREIKQYERLKAKYDRES